jgi:hypothetical protein
MAFEPSLRELSRSALTLVLAGGRGSRLGALTDRRAKPAVHFGGKLRIIDFALSNTINSGFRQIAVLTQYKSHSLLRHLQRGWSFLRGEMGEFVDLLPAQQRVNEENWYRGTADAVFQNLDIFHSLRPSARHHPRRRPHLQDGLRQDAVVARAARRRRHGRLHRGPAQGGQRLRRHAHRRPRPDLELRREAEGPAADARAPRHLARLQHGRLRLQRQLPVRPAPARRRRPEQPRLRQGHHPATWSTSAPPSTPTASPRAASSPSPARPPTGATSAPSTPTGRPTSTSPASSPRSTSTTPTGGSGPTRSSSRPPSSSTTTTPAAARP